MHWIIGDESPPPPVLLACIHNVCHWDGMPNVELPSGNKGKGSSLSHQAFYPMLGMGGPRIWRRQLWRLNLKRR